MAFTPPPSTTLKQPSTFFDRPLTEGTVLDIFEALLESAVVAEYPISALKSVLEESAVLIKLSGRASIELNILQSISDEEDSWFHIGYIKGNNFDIRSYFQTYGNTSKFDLNKLPDYSGYSEVVLEPGRVYKYRITTLKAYGSARWRKVEASMIDPPDFRGNNYRNSNKLSGRI